MSDPVTWQDVAMALVSAIPSIIAACASCLAVWKSAKNGEAIDKVATTVNGHTTVLRDKLDAALSEVGKLTGRPAKTESQAPSVAQSQAAPTP